MPDITEVWRLHEEYKDAPPVGAGNTVLIKLRNRNIWELGIACPPRNVNWSPGSPIGKRFDILLLQPGGNPKPIEDCCHIKDPLYLYDPTNTRHGWEAISSLTTENLTSAFNELISKVVQTQSDLQVQTEITRNLQTELAKLSAQVNSPKATRKPDRQLAEVA